MKALLLGCGRMGIRHARGLLASPQLSSLHIADINPESMNSARAQLESQSNFSRCTFGSAGEALSYPHGQPELVVVAATAADRLATMRQVYELSPRFVLVEKPLGQSQSQVEQLLHLAESSPASTFVNLNMRLYDYYRQLRDDFRNVEQLSGFKSISFNSGSVGIGANGIHFLDLLFFLLDAKSAQLNFATVESQTLPSGRGPQFREFGGLAVLSFAGDAGQPLGQAHLCLSVQSSVFGAWDFVGPHGRVRIDEMAQKRANHYRMQDSQMPLSRYGADYGPEQAAQICVPDLADLTRLWFEALVQGKELLPTLRESLPAHQVLFDWLAHSPTHQAPFPIT